MPSRLSRRRFLKGAAATTAAAGWLPTILRAEKAKPAANERLQVACVGVSGMGGSDMNSVAAAGAEIVALCDCNEAVAAKAREQFPKAAFFTDWRQMLDKGKGFDAVTVGVPDHNHAVITIAALKAGKHVYCEKPLTHTVFEARRVATTAAQMKRVTQMGTQVHGGANYRRVVELVQSGAIGPVKEAHVWCDKQFVGRDRPDGMPVPPGLNWDTWLGPAPERAYNKCYVPFHWREWWDFGGGTLNDMACHYMDLPFWALKLRHPTRVAVEGPAPHKEGPPGTLTVNYDFPSRDGMPEVKLTWYHGGQRPKYFADGKVPKWGDGVLFVGEKGMLIASYGDNKLLPEKEFADFKRPEPTIAVYPGGHYKEWVDACKSGGPTTCNFDYSGALTEAVLLGTVSFRSGKAFSWDGKAFKTSEPEADRWLHKEYRKGWTL